ncbi:ASTRA-associated protein 1 [Diutina catenulata]
MSLVYSLRGHGDSVTAMASTRFGVVSGDRTGQVIVWNLKSRRAHRQWKAHDDAVVTIVDWNNYLVTHGRDGEIRGWDMSGDGKVPKCAVNIPVNALNFCNIVLSGKYLFTPATTDSNNFDVYRIDSEESLIRVVQGCSGYNVVGVTEVSSSGESRDWGVVMKMAWIAQTSTLCVGYESGDVIGLRIEFDQYTETTKSKPSAAKAEPKSGASGLSAMLEAAKGNQEKTIINKGPKLTCVYHNLDHRPEPVTALHYDSQIQRLVTASATKKMLIHDLGSDSAEEMELPSRGVSAIDCFGDRVVAGQWDGSIAITVGKQVVTTFSRPIPSDRHFDSETGKLQSQVKLASILCSEDPRRGELVFGGFADGVIAAVKF